MYLKKIKRINKNVKKEADVLLTKQAMKNLLKRLEKLDTDYDSLTIREKMDLLEREKEKLQDKATNISIGAVVSFLLFGF